MTVSQHTIAGTVITMPVRVRRSTLRLATFAVDAGAAQAMIDYSGLQVCQFRPGRAMVGLMLVHYLDGDLGQYYEYGTSVMVNPPGSTATGLRALGSAGAFIHHLPVDQSFTLEAGVRIWGYPKVLANFAVRDTAGFGFTCSIDGRMVIDMQFRAGLPVPAPRRGQELRSYTHRDGITRVIPFEQKVSGVRARPGGVSVRLGDHPYARDLAALGLPKHALMSVSADQVALSFDDASEIA